MSNIQYLDLNAFWQASWAADFGNRAFRFDAFITHNRADAQSKRLSNELARRDAEVWHDEDRDLSDRRVQEIVAAALIQSRYVIVSIGADFQDSIWCRAEYLPARAVETLAAGTRVLIARMDADAAIPDDLAGVQQFDCYREEEIDRLCTMIMNGNRLPFDAEPTPTPTIDWSDLRSRAAAILDTLDGEDDETAVLCSIACSVQEENGPRVVPQALEAARSLFIERMPLADLTSERRQFLLDASRFFCTLNDSDDRANGIFMLQHFAEHDPVRTLHDEVALLFEREPNDALMGIGLQWFEKQWDVLTVRQRSIAERCAMRASGWFNSRGSATMGREFAEVTRVKIFNRGLEVLTSPEQMHLLMERATRIFMNTQPITGDSNDDRLRQQMGVPDIEIVFRNLAKVRREHLQHPNGEWTSPDVDVLAFVECIIRHSVEHGGFPILTMEDVDLLAFVLEPLLRFSARPELRDPASRAYRTLCDLIESRKPNALEVPIYREFLDLALGGADVNAGFFEPMHVSLLLLHRANLKRVWGSAGRP